MMSTVISKSGEKDGGDGETSQCVDAGSTTQCCFKRKLKAFVKTGGRTTVTNQRVHLLMPAIIGFIGSRWEPTFIM